MALFRDPDRQREFEAILDAIDEAIMTVDRDFCVVAFNQAAENLTGYDRREALTGRCFDVCAGRFCRHSCDIEMMFATGAPPEDFDAVVQGKDGRMRVVRVRTIPFRDRRGRILAAIRILKDVTGTVPMVQAAGAAHEPLIGEGPAMQKVFQAIDRLKDSEAPLVIWGPAGTEKESLARAIHARSLRAAGPFIPVHTSDLGPDSAEAELERALLLSRGGTLYVHDFSRLADAARARLEEAVSGASCAPHTPEVWPGAGGARNVGRPGSPGHEPQPDHALVPRLIAAVDRDPWEADGERTEAAWIPPAGWHSLRLPPLAQRREDIPLLADHRLQQLRVSAGAPTAGLTTRALRALMSYPFPGNVEELDRILRFALAFRRATWADRAGRRSGRALHQADAIDLEDLPPEVQAAVSAVDPAARRADPTGTTDAGGPRERRPAREEILQALNETGWQMGRAARRLGIDRTTLWRRMKRLGIRRP